MTLRVKKGINQSNELKVFKTKRLFNYNRFTKIIHIVDENEDYY